MQSQLTLQNVKIVDEAERHHQHGNGSIESSPNQQPGCCGYGLSGYISMCGPGEQKGLVDPRG